MGAKLSLYEDKFDLFEKQLADIARDFPKLHYCETKEGLVLEGEISFNLTCRDVGETIEDSYLIQIQFPQDYPDSPPKAKEIGGKIHNFHKNKNGTLCLDIPSRVYIIFRENTTIQHFIHELLEPYLYSHSYWKKHNGKMPFGYRAHYGDGILDYYSEYFGVEDKEIVIDFLELLAKRDYKQSMPCPCGSKNKIKKCCGRKFLDIYNSVPVKIIRYELDQAKLTINSRLFQIS